MLYLIATPIGHLEDISYRAVATLKKCDYILCEDTRYSKRLLDAYDIQKPLRSYHKFNEQKQIEKIIEELQAGQEIGLISDAGTPGICDPGSRLIQACVEYGVAFTAIPGASALLTALCLSGLSTERFQFLGFLPKGTTDCAALFDDLLSYPGTSVVYETPHRLLKTLQLLEKMAPDRTIAIARELTKMHEECLRGKVQDLLKQIENIPSLKGEFVLLIEGRKEEEPLIVVEDLSIKQQVERIEKQGNFSQSEAVKRVAKAHGVSQREIYRQLRSD